MDTQLVSDPNLILKLDTIIQLIKYSFLVYGLVFACLIVTLFAKAWIKNG